MDLTKAGKYIENLLRADAPASEKIKQLVTWCSGESPSPRWAEILEVDWPHGLRHLRDHVTSAMRQMPNEVNALYAGIGTYGDLTNTEYCDFYLAGSTGYTHYDPEIEWAFDPDWEQDPSGNPAMREMYGIAYMPGDGKLGNDCEYPLALGFVNFGLIECLDVIPERIRCVAAGFDSGEYLFPRR